jgi:predicted amidohydrolase
MSKGVINVATVQFAVGDSLIRNSKRIQDYMTKAAKAKADIVHFPECALCGYAGTDILSLDGYDWPGLDEQTGRIAELAGKLGIWAAVGTMHRVNAKEKPRNTLKLFAPDGKIKGRYDKRFGTERDLKHYRSGEKFFHFTINGVKCSLLICFDLRFPEIYRALRKENVDFILQSFYNARQDGPSVHTQIMRQTMQCRAATNYFWVSMSNASGYYSPYPSCFIRPDGVIVKQLKSNRAGMMINRLDINERYYDPSEPFREMTMGGKLSNRSKL